MQGQMTGQIGNDHQYHMQQLHAEKFPYVGKSRLSLWKAIWPNKEVSCQHWAEMYGKWPMTNLYFHPCLRCLHVSWL